MTQVTCFSWIPHLSVSFDTLWPEDKFRQAMTDAADAYSLSIDSPEDGIMMEYSRAPKSAIRHDDGQAIGITIPTGFHYSDNGKHPAEPIIARIISEGEPSDACIDIRIEATGLLTAKGNLQNSNLHMLAYDSHRVILDVFTDAALKSEDGCEWNWRANLFRPGIYSDREAAVAGIIRTLEQTIHAQQCIQRELFDMMADRWRVFEFRSRFGMSMIRVQYRTLKDIMGYCRSFVSLMIEADTAERRRLTESLDLYECSVDTLYRTHIDHYSNHLSSAMRALTLVTVLATALSLATILMGRRASGGSVGYNYYRARD